MKSFLLPVILFFCLCTSTIQASKLPHFKLQGADGKTISSEEYEGKVLVINFWFTSCPPCIKEIPKLNQLTYLYASNPNVKFLAIATDNAQSVNSFLLKTPFKYRIGVNGLEVMDKFGFNASPSHLIVDAKGNIVFKKIGTDFMINVILDQAITKAINNQFSESEYPVIKSESQQMAELSREEIQKLCLESVYHSSERINYESINGCPSLLAGKQAPAFSGKDQFGNTFMMNEFKDKPVVLYFGKGTFGTYAAIAELEAMQSRMKDVKFVAVIKLKESAKERQEVITFLKNKNLKFADLDNLQNVSITIIEDKGDLFTLYGIKGNSTTFVINQKIVSYLMIGYPLHAYNQDNISLCLVENHLLSLKK